MMAVKFYMLQYNLFFLVVRFSKLEILMTAKLIEFFFLRRLQMGPVTISFLNLRLGMFLSHLYVFFILTPMRSMKLSVVFKRALY